MECRHSYLSYFLRNRIPFFLLIILARGSGVTTRATSVAFCFGLPKSVFTPIRMGPTDINRFKAAAVRLFFDMINADGVIEDNEVFLLQGVDRSDSPTAPKEAKKLMCAGGLYNKYHINDIARREATRLTTTDAIKILIDWQENGESVECKYNPNSAYTTRNVITDLETISECDGRRNVEENRFLAAISWCLKEGVPTCERTIPVSCEDCAFRFAEKEIIYLEDGYDKDINEEIMANRVL